MTHSKHLRAIVLATIAFTCWVLSDAGIKLASEAGLPPFEVLGLLGLFSGITVALKAWPERKARALWPKNPRAQFIRALLSLTTTALNVVALKHLPLTMFYVTVFAAPMMIAIGASLWLREQLGWAKMLAIILGFIGVVIAIDPFHDVGQGDWIGYGAAFIGTVCFAVSTVWLRTMTQSETADSLTFFTALVEAIAGLGLMLFWHVAPLTGWPFLVMAITAIVNVAGCMSMYTALRDAPAATIAPFHYTQLISGALLGYLIWHDVPGLHTVIGAAIIIGTGVWITLHSRKVPEAIVTAPM